MSLTEKWRKAPLISKAHSDKVGICFGLLVSVASVLIILMAAGVIKISCTPCDEKDR